MVSEVTTGQAPATPTPAPTTAVTTATAPSAPIPAPPAPIPAPPAAPKPQVNPIVARVHDSIERWFQDSFVGTALGQDVQTWNLLHHAKDDLKTRLAALIKEL